MKDILLMIFVLFVPVASAAPLLGTTGSFDTSGPCKVDRCSLSSREPIAKTIVDFRYTFPSKSSVSPNQIREAGPTISVIRVNNVVMSLGFEAATQDSIFAGDNYLSNLLSRIFAFAAGTTINSSVLFDLDRKCEQAKGKEAVIRIKTFTLSCVNSSGEYTNSRRVIYRIY